MLDWLLLVLQPQSREQQIENEIYNNEVSWLSKAIAILLKGQSDDEIFDK